jgi:protocatechuate 3,4-dioxygenase beta subunit
MSKIQGYRRPLPASQPEYLHPPYRSTAKRSPSQPLLLLPHTLSEITGPVFGTGDVTADDNDLTKQHAGEPIGERIFIGGRVLDENGRPVRNTLVEVWQCNAAAATRTRTTSTTRRSTPTSPAAAARSPTARAATRFQTIKPARIPWGNHHNAWRPRTSTSRSSARRSPRAS